MKEVGSLVCTPTKGRKGFGDKLDVCKAVSTHQQFVGVAVVGVGFGVRHQDLRFLSLQPTL